MHSATKLVTESNAHAAVRFKRRDALSIANVSQTDRFPRGRRGAGKQRSVKPGGCHVKMSVFLKDLDSSTLICFGFRLISLDVK